ncbi:MAG TPA: zinc-ribbon domain-containing protein [Candidatus Dormibacteraeota bacterium]|nr:zinc-ribbon domain-containing protein [Candidatus Dormibacteraeota bacterium]
MSPARRKDDQSPNAGETTTCPWCSATVPATAVTCPSCGASLRDAADGDVAGVTQVDPQAIARVRRVKPRRLTSWLTGDGTAEDETGGTVEPPTEEVRREMLRLELAAIDAELEAKAQQAAAQRDLPLAEAAEAANQPGTNDAPGAGSG